MLLKDKVVIVSGIGPGLGVKLATEAAREGARGVILSARTASKLDDAEARIQALGVDCEILKQSTDITDARQCEALAKAANERFGRIDVLVNSAFNHGEFDHAATADLDAWQAPLQTNLIGTLKMTQAAIPYMREHGGGAIVMIGTMAASKPPAFGEAGYAASKAALVAAVKDLAIELGPDNIRVNVASMGWMWGAPVEGYMNWQAEQTGVSVEQIKEPVEAEIPLRRIPPDEECARAALFLASDYASVVTGANLDVNGGHYIR
jgi:NAD(P)-dependent dehydrogenase (short-subunit alcohol dehydrogenase family)